MWDGTRFGWVPGTGFEKAPHAVILLALECMKANILDNVRGVGQAPKVEGASVMEGKLLEMLKRRQNGGG